MLPAPPVSAGYVPYITAATNPVSSPSEHSPGLLLTLSCQIDCESQEGRAWFSLVAVVTVTSVELGMVLDKRGAFATEID